MALIVLSFFSIKSFSQKVGVFDGHNDVGEILHSGSAALQRPFRTIMSFQDLVPISGLPVMHFITYGKK